MKEDIPARLDRLIKERGLKRKPVSLAAGLGETAVADIISGRSSQPRAETLNKIAAVLEIEPSILIYGEESNPVTAAQSKLHPTVTQSAATRDLPIYGDPSTIGNAFALNIGQPIDFIARPAIFANNTRAFACYVTGNDMEPRYYRGELLLVDPVRPFQVTDYVLIEHTEGTASVRLLQDIASESITVTRLNPEEEQTIARDDIRHIYKIAGSYDI